MMDMARKAAWEDLVEADLGPYGKSRGTRWGRVFVGLLLVAGATFVAAYYLPLYRAHQKLGEQYRELGQRSQTLTENATRTETELKAATAERDQLRSERDQKDSAKKSRKDQSERVRGALASKLDKLVKKGSAAVVVADDGTLSIALDAALLFAPQKLELSAAGRTLLCDIAKTGEAKSIAVRDSVADGATVPPALSASFGNPWSFSAARAATVAQGLQETCSLTPAQLSAVGSATRDPLAAQLGSLKAPLDRIELELAGH